MTDTIFHKILRKEIPADVVYEDDFVLAFRDIRPVAETHVLVIPKFDAESFSDIRNWTPAQTTGYFQGLSLCAKALGLDGPGYRVVFNTGEMGGQEVPYIHAHLISGRKLNWPPG